MTKKPKPPKTFQEVEDYIREKSLNVSPKAFWNYFETGDWHDSEGKPVLCWKQKLLTWHGRDKRTIMAEKAKKSENQHTKTGRQRTRYLCEDYLKSKSDSALMDLKNDGGGLSQAAGWLIDEILNNRQRKELGL